MFTQQQLDIIEQVGTEGLSLKVAASQLKMTYNKFMEEYVDNEDAQLAFEKGQSALEIKAVTIANASMEKGDSKAFDFITDKVLNMSGKIKQDALKTSSKKNDVVNPLLNPTLLLELDDDELKRKADLKRAEEEDKNPIKVDKDEGDE